MTNQVISANRLADGIVVYLTADGGWAERIANARIVAGNEQIERALAASVKAVGDRIIVDPYLIDIEDGAGQRRPTRYRELIRALGPTVRPDLGKQAAR